MDKATLLSGSFRDSRPECLECPARKGRYVPPTIVDGSALACLGERPGATESLGGKVFIGKAGTILDKLLNAGGTHRELVSILNTVACYLDNNPKPTVDEIACCAGVVDSVLDAIKPRVILALGEVALRRLTGRSKPTAWRGSIFRPDTVINLGQTTVFGPEVFKSGKRKGQLKPKKADLTITQTRGKTVVSTLHPAELVYTGFASWTLVVADVRRARLLAEDQPLLQVGYQVTGKVSDPERLKLLLAANREVVLDVETDSYAGRLNLIGISVGADHGESFYPSGDVLQTIATGLAEHTRLLIGHNLSYDLKVLSTNGVERECSLWDTMHAAHFERPDLPATLRPKALDTVASRLTNIHYRNWKQDFREGLNPNGVLYNQLDCAYTFAVKNEMEARLAQTGRLKHFNNVLMKCLPVLIKLEKEGVRVDVDKLSEMRDEQQGVVDKLLEEWQKVAPEVNPRSPKQLQVFFYEKLGLKVQYTKTEEGVRPSLDKEALIALVKEYPDRTEPRILAALRHAEKIQANYLTLELDENNRLHPQYNLSETVFGRLSSGGETGFNFQNIPRIGEGCPAKVERCQCVHLREIFVADVGDLDVAVGDWSQIEYRIVALLGREDWLIEALKDPKFDLHADTASKLGVSRQIGKTVNHASNYGASATKLAMVTKRTQAECARFLALMHSIRPNIARWQQELILHARKNGWVANPFGRRAYFKVDRDGNVKPSEVLAFPPQSTAADMMLIAIIEADRLGLKLRWTVHDELGISRRNEADLTLLQQVMERWYEELSFSNPVDLGTGVSWAKAKSH